MKVAIYARVRPQTTDKTQRCRLANFENMRSAAVGPSPSHHFAENPTGENLTIYQSLAAHGLLEESYEQKRPDRAEVLVQEK